MRPLLLCLIGLTAFASDAAFAQMKLPSKSAPGASEVRYFTAIDGLMEGNADVVLKETRQGKTVTSAVTEVISTDNSDLSEKEYLESQTRDDGIAAAPKDFTDVSPESVGVRVRLDAALDFLKSLKGQDLEVSLSSLTVSCDALRAGEQ